MKCKCGQELFPGQFRCHKCGKIVKKEKKEVKKPEKQEGDK